MIELPHPSLLTIRVAAAFAALATLSIVVQLAARERTPPVRCPDGMLPAAGRCCGQGQIFAAGRCEGKPRSCGADHEFLAADDEIPGCVLRNERIPNPGGVLPPGAVDFQLRDRAAPVRVAPFEIDRGEVTVHRYAACVAAGACARLPAPLEVGLPVTGLPADAAEAFCRFAGGRLPSSAEWKLAAGGLEARRFAWGFTGLVCRRAAFGLTAGPCSSEGTGPDLAGARPDGATPDGVLDLTGNVAEWTRDLNGRYRARGGSYRSRVAVELLVAAVEVAPPNALHVGFRCAYDPSVE